MPYTVRRRMPFPESVHDRGLAVFVSIVNYFRSTPANGSTAKFPSAGLPRGSLILEEHGSRNPWTRLPLAWIQGLLSAGEH
jgi:hypothetical protein